MIPVYDYAFENGKYHFVTDNHCVYEVRFSNSDRFFDKHCSSCKDIFEVEIVPEMIKRLEQQFAKYLKFSFLTLVMELCIGVGTMMRKDIRGK